MQVPARQPGSVNKKRNGGANPLGISCGKTTVIDILTTWFTNLATEVLFVPSAPVDN